MNLIKAASWGKGQCYFVDQEQLMCGYTTQQMISLVQQLFLSNSLVPTGMFWYMKITLMQEKRSIFL